MVHDKIYYRIRYDADFQFEYVDVGGYEDIGAEPVTLAIKEPYGADGIKVTLAPQHLMELGALFIALAGVTGINFSDVEALLDGYGLKGKEAVEKLGKALTE